MSDPGIVLSFSVSYVLAGLVLLGVSLGGIGTAEKKLAPVRLRRK
jgi:hypothetical protein